MRRFASTIIGLSTLCGVFIWQYVPDVLDQCSTQERVTFRLNRYDQAYKTFRPVTNRICNSIEYSRIPRRPDTLGGWGRTPVQQSITPMY